jgi:integrase
MAGVPRFCLVAHGARGAALALRWRDVDLDAGRLQVRRNLALVKARGDGESAPGGEGVRQSADQPGKNWRQLSAGEEREEVACRAFGAPFTTRPGIGVTRPSAEDCYSNRYSNALRTAANRAGLRRTKQAADLDKQHVRER